MDHLLSKEKANKEKGKKVSSLLFYLVLKDFDLSFSFIR